jgi:CHASE1-domain containing sensor protein
MFIAAIQFSNANGKRPSRNDIVQCIYTDSQHRNLLNRVAPVGNSDSNIGLNYYKEKYKDMLLDAAVDRTLYGKLKDR